MKPILIFDLDGTLIDSAPSILAGFTAALEEAGIESRLPLTPNVIGPPLMQTLALLSGSDDPALLQQLADGFKRHYDTTGYQRTVAFAGVADVLKALAECGAELHIATNKRLFPTENILKFLGWRQYFHTVYALDMPGRGFKNKAAMLAGQLQDIAPSAPVYYVGDRQEDREAAECNGLPFVAACWGYGGFADQAPNDVSLAAHKATQLLEWWQSLSA